MADLDTESLKALFAYLPVETVVRDHQEDYYRVLAQADERGDATLFVEFMLQSLRSAIEEAVTSDQVSDQVIRLLEVLGSGEIGAADLMGKLNLSHRPTFRKNYLEPALTAGVIERTLPESPRSPTQRYRLTKKGRAFISKRKKSIVR